MTMNPKAKPYDAAEFLTDEETVSAYLIEALETGDPRIISKALGAVARAPGFTGCGKNSMEQAL
jgi:probable addiction module antidote protein